MSSLDLSQQASTNTYKANTRRKDIDEHLPTQVLVRILTFCSPSTLAHCLTVSRLFFHLAGDLLYNDISLTSKDFFLVFRGRPSCMKLPPAKLLSAGRNSKTGC